VLRSQDSGLPAFYAHAAVVPRRSPTNIPRRHWPVITGTCLAYRS